MVLRKGGMVYIPGDEDVVSDTVQNCAQNLSIKGGAACIHSFLSDKDNRGNPLHYVQLVDPNGRFLGCWVWEEDLEPLQEELREKYQEDLAYCLGEKPSVGADMSNIKEPSHATTH